MECTTPPTREVQDKGLRERQRDRETKRERVSRERVSRERERESIERERVNG